QARWDALAVEDVERILDTYPDFQRDLRNPSHPRTVSLLDQVVPLIMERRGIHGGYRDVVDGLPPSAGGLARAAVEQSFRAEIAPRQAAAADPVLLGKRQPAGLRDAQARRAGEQWLIVQHKASGVGARFMYRREPPDRDGTVYARPY